MRKRPGGSFAYAVSLGADPATWTRSQFVRMPGGRRDNGKVQGGVLPEPSFSCEESVGIKRSKRRTARSRGRHGRAFNSAGNLKRIGSSCLSLISLGWCRFWFSSSGLCLGLLFTYLDISTVLLSG